MVLFFFFFARSMTYQIITNVFVQTVILLYLIDNNENTSWMILMGSGMGVLIEAWKVRSESLFRPSYYRGHRSLKFNRSPKLWISLLPPLQRDRVFRTGSTSKV